MQFLSLALMLLVCYCVKLQASGTHDPCATNLFVKCSLRILNVTSKCEEAVAGTFGSVISSGIDVIQKARDFKTIRRSFYGVLSDFLPELDNVTKLYKFYNVSRLNYTEAEEVCRLANGHLARYDNENELAILKCMTNHSSSHHKAFVGLQRCRNLSRWAGPCPPNKPSALNDSSKEENCHAMTLNGLVESSCADRLMFVCYAEKVSCQLNASLVKETRDKFEECLRSNNQEGRATTTSTLTSELTNPQTEADGSNEASTNENYISSVSIRKTESTSSFVSTATEETEAPGFRDVSVLLGIDVSPNQSIAFNLGPTTKKGDNNVVLQRGGFKLISVGDSNGSSVHVSFVTLKQGQVFYNISPPTTLDGVIYKQEFPLSALLSVATQHSLPVEYSIEVGDLTLDKRSKNIFQHENFHLLSAVVECVYVTNTRRLSNCGIKTIDAASSNYICSSNHTTVFTSLLKLEYLNIPLQVPILITVTLTISCISLVVTIAILLSVRKILAGNRVMAQINLALALLLFSASRLAVQHLANRFSSYCVGLAILTQLWLLATVFWMLVEGITLYATTIGNKLQHRRTTPINIARFLVGWGIPVLLVVASCAVGFSSDSYMPKNPELILNVSGVKRYRNCFMNKRSCVMLWGILIPVVLVLFTNFCIMIRMGLFVYTMSQKAHKFMPTCQKGRCNQANRIEASLIHGKAALRAIVLLTPVLGFSWILMSIRVFSPVLIVVNAVVNGLQGFFLFLVYCVFNTEVRGAIRLTWNRYRHYNFFQARSTFFSRGLRHVKR